MRFHLPTSNNLHTCHSRHRSSAPHVSDVHKKRFESDINRYHCRISSVDHIQAWMRSTALYLPVKFDAKSSKLDPVEPSTMFDPSYFKTALLKIEYVFTRDKYSNKELKRMSTPQRLIT